MTVYEIYKNAIKLGHYNVAEMESKIEAMFASGKINALERVTLLNLCDENADDRYQLDIVAKLAELEERIARIESAGVVVWTSGHTTHKGETVGGAVTHRIEKDSEGNIILVPVDGGEV